MVQVRIPFLRRMRLILSFQLAGAFEVGGREVRQRHRAAGLSCERAHASFVDGAHLLLALDGVTVASK